MGKAGMEAEGREGGGESKGGLRERPQVSGSGNWVKAAFFKKRCSHEM